MPKIQINEVGAITDYQGGDWCSKGEIMIPVIGHPCFISLENYATDPQKEEFHAALANLVKLKRSALESIENEIFRYYKETNDACWEETDPEYLKIDSPSEVWRHIKLGAELDVRRRPYGDKKIYISLSCECDWEEEHGLQIVFKEGLAVNKIGGYDGHLTNSDAYGDQALENVIYH